MANLFSEMKRRNVVRVGVAYIVVGWVVLQVGDILLDMFEAPPWVGKTLAVVLLLGFPLACLFAWAFELTPEGVMRTEEVDRSESITHSTGKKLNYLIIAALVVALGYFVWERQHLVEPNEVTTTATDKSIAVLPFINMSSDEEQEWFADGLTEEILNSLARTPDLLVASRTSSFQYKGQTADVSTIADALGVAHILEGSVRRGGDRLRVTAQLIRASDGFHLWSETFDSTPDDVIAIQENVAIEIANALKTAMDPDALKDMVSAGTSSVAAYEAYLEGLALTGKSAATGNMENWGLAYAAFNRAVEIDPAFALAHWYRAAYWQSQLDITTVGSDLSAESPEEDLANYLEAVNAAIATEDSDALALKYKGNKAENELRIAEAIEFYSAYLEEYPNDTEAQQMLIGVIATTRDADAARDHLRRMVGFSTDDPLQLNSLIINLLFVGLVDEAVELSRDVIQRYPQHASLLYQAHRALLWGGNTQEAGKLVSVLQGTDFPEANIKLVSLRQACAEGDQERARRLYKEIAEIDLKDPSVYFISSQIMGRPEEAHQLLADAKLRNRELASFLNYPYFNHTYFPELEAILDRQMIDRPYIEGPPYACR